MSTPRFVKYNGVVYKRVSAGVEPDVIFHDSTYQHDGIEFYVYLLFNSATGGGLESIAKKVKKKEFNDIMDSGWLTPEQKAMVKKSFELDGNHLWKVELTDHGWFWRQRQFEGDTEQKSRKTFSVQNIDKVQKVLNFIEKCRQSGGGPAIYARISNKFI